MPHGDSFMVTSQKLCRIFLARNQENTIVHQHPASKVGWFADVFFTLEAGNVQDFKSLVLLPIVFFFKLAAFSPTFWNSLLVYGLKMFETGSYSRNIMTYGISGLLQGLSGYPRFQRKISRQFLRIDS